MKQIIPTSQDCCGEEMDINSLPMQGQANVGLLFNKCTINVMAFSPQFSSPVEATVKQRWQVTGLLTVAHTFQGPHSYSHFAWNAILSGPAPSSYPNYFHLSSPTSFRSLPRWLQWISALLFSYTVTPPSPEDCRALSLYQSTMLTSSQAPTY